MAKERLGKMCPKCHVSHLMKEKWTEYPKSVEYRITCEDLSCDYKPVHIHDLKWIQKGILIFFLFCHPFLMPYLSEAEMSIAVKEGFTYFDKHQTSRFEGNNIYDNEWTDGGVYVRLRQGRFFERLDYDTLRTGDEFQSTLPKSIPYEGVHIRLHEIVSTFGIFPFGKYLYFGAGPGLEINKVNVLTFPNQTIIASSRPSLILSLLSGVEYPIFLSLKGFVEIRRNFKMWSLEIAEVGEPGTSPKSGELKEVLDNTAIFTGVSWTF